MNLSSAFEKFAILAMLFVVGFVLMGFEMLGSRYLNPYFGSGITTWASLISVVLLSMMVGYFAGGYAADRYPGILPLAGVTALASALLVLVSIRADAVILYIMDTAGDGFWGVLLASFALVFVPVGLLSACSPYVVRLLLSELKYGGRTTGLVYAVSTFGNVVGTLATTFWLIPEFGTRTITKFFAVALVALAVAIFARTQWHKRGTRNMTSVIIVTIIAGLAFYSSPANATVQHIAASYPEGPIWLGDRLLYAEMGADRISQWQAGTRTTFWSQPGCGPTAITKFKTDQIAVNCHFARKIVILNLAGQTVFSVDRAANGTALRNPNDINADGNNGAFFSDPGPFALSAQATGIVYRLAPTGTLISVKTNLKYPNGVAFDPKQHILYVSEHLAQRVLAFRLDKSYAVLDQEVALSSEQIFGNDEPDYPMSGPDGLRIDSEGNIFVAIYGAGLVIVVTPEKRTHKVEVPMKFVTSIATSKHKIAITGAHDNEHPPYPGEVLIVDKSHFMGANRVGF